MNKQECSCVAACRPYHRHHTTVNRVANLHRQVKDVDSDSDVEIASLDVDPQIAPTVDLSALVSREIAKQQLEQQFQNSALSIGGSSSTIGAVLSTSFTNTSSSNGGGSTSTTGEQASSSHSRQPLRHSDVPSAFSCSSSQENPLFEARHPLSGFTVSSSADGAGSSNGSSSTSSSGSSFDMYESVPDDASTQLLSTSSSRAAAVNEQQLATATATALPTQQPPQEKLHGGIPKSILVISLVSMALTSASCVFNTLLPIYMVTELKMSMKSMGMFEGRYS